MVKNKTKLNRRGVLQLADDLVANVKRYDQSTFGDVRDECGTVMCLAGFCYRREVGPTRFARMVKVDNVGAMDAIASAVKQLGITNESLATTRVFASESSWPPDLHEEYLEAESYYSGTERGRRMVIVALKVLQRLKPNGTIDSNRKAVHTRIPHLKALLKTVNP